MHEFDALKNSEVNYFRSQMKALADDMARSRQNKSWLDRLYYQHPPRIALSDNLLETIACRLQEGQFKLTVKNTSFENTEVGTAMLTIYYSNKHDFSNSAMTGVTAN